MQSPQPDSNRQLPDYKSGTLPIKVMRANVGPLIAPQSTSTTDQLPLGLLHNLPEAGDSNPNYNSDSVACKPLHYAPELVPTYGNFNPTYSIGDPNHRRDLQISEYNRISLPSNSSRLRYALRQVLHLCVLGTSIFNG